MPIIRIYVCFHEGGKRREKQKNPHLKQVLGRDPSTSSIQLSSMYAMCNDFFSSVIFNEQSIFRKGTDLLFECHLLGD